ncbi:OLC1v1035436C1 [Oldenlandia corymbosa var. corymbosa]|uniref:OLC1v1035436C1 n=1 Tax=Oldenlandia corymbosa var. corymbosa TaxID=529605 RepID=A0AAV1CU65_OLDCO|nr:OLC1v1035436C1 [Oldenlandia corymbosa var. corymbosa]
MAESGMGKLSFDIDMMKETLCAQQQLLQKLYNELDAEREASSTAASEALAMILRLQGEKAAVQMEAEQYKRLAEEKMCYAEESLSIFEDIMYQKEMEVSALDYQVQAYRYKLLSMGCADQIGEIKFPENLLQRNENLAGEMSLKNLSRRNSAPPISLKAYLKKGINESEDCSSPDIDLVSRTVESCKGQELQDLNSDWDKKTDISSSGDISSYLDQIRKLDGRIKEIAGVSYANLRNSSRSPSPLSQKSGIPYDSIKGTADLSPSVVLHPTPSGIDLVKHSGSPQETEIKDENADSPGILDVFEVPQVDERYDDSQLKRRNQRKMVVSIDEGLQKPDFTEETIKPSNHDDNHWLYKMVKSSNQEKDVSIPSGGLVEVDCTSAIVHPRSKPPKIQSKLRKLGQASEIVEVERQASRKECIDREEELKLLKEIKEQLSSLQGEISSWKIKEAAAAPTPTDDLPLHTLSEAMLYFWM